MRQCIVPLLREVLPAVLDDDEVPVVVATQHSECT